MNEIGSGAIVAGEQQPQSIVVPELPSYVEKPVIQNVVATCYLNVPLDLQVLVDT